jgi:hypothetical protein
LSIEATFEEVAFFDAAIELDGKLVEGDNVCDD